MKRSAACQMLEDLYFIERGLLNSNLVVLRGAAPVVIDTGYVTHARQTLALLRGLDVAPERVTLLLGTHTHADHVGGHGAIQRLAGCPALLHRRGKEYLERGRGEGTWVNYFGYTCDPFTCDGALEDGQELPIGPHVFRVLHLPGHAADCVGLYAPREKLLIAGDALLERTSPLLALQLEGEGMVDAMQESMARLAALEIRTVYPGHGPPFHDAAGAIARTLQRLAGYPGNREALGRQFMRSILLCQLAIRGPIARDELLAQVLAWPWFAQSATYYFGASDHAALFASLLGDVIAAGAAQEHAGLLRTDLPL